MTNALEKLQNATRMLAEVRSAEDAKQVMDIASAAEHYARKHRLGEEAIQHAHAIKIEASAMLGKFIQENDGGYNPPLPKSVSKDDSRQHRFLATVKEERPEQFQAIKAGQKAVTQVKREVIRESVLQKVRDLPSGQFRVFYADPPWNYNDKNDEGGVQVGGGAEHHYPSMTIAELSSMPVEERAEGSAVLFLWVTSPLLFECLPVIRAWGFQYKASFVWDKIKHNMGHYNSVRHELLLICTRGSCTPDVNKLHDSVQSIERREHSRKPEEFRAIIDEIYPYGRRVELFARGDVPEPWEKWGAESE